MYFFLFLTRKYKNNESHKIRLYHEYELLPHWNLNLPLKVIIHGWLDSTYHEDGVFCIKNGELMFIRNNTNSIIYIIMKLLFVNQILILM